jgi:hypothetical protein
VARIHCPKDDKATRRIYATLREIGERKTAAPPDAKMLPF